VPADRRSLHAYRHQHASASDEQSCDAEPNQREKSPHHANHQRQSLGWLQLGGDNGTQNPKHERHPAYPSNGTCKMDKFEHKVSHGALSKMACILHLSLDFCLNSRYLRFTDGFLL
jgi:hypothetical protein